MSGRAESENVSPTAYATGAFWYRHGLSHKGLLLPQSARAGRSFSVLRGLVRLFGGGSFTALMLARHKGIDAVLARAIDAGKVGQVVELAAGLSPRGWRFTQKYGDRIEYVETDLPKMVALKERLLAKSKLHGPRHRVVAVNALSDSGPDSLAALAATLDPGKGLAIVTEGLMSYLDPDAARGVWQRIAEVLKRFPHGVYLSDMYLRRDRHGLGALLFRAAIQRAVRGRMFVHFETPDEAVAKLTAAGFASVTLHEPRTIPETRELGETRGGDRVRVLEATV
ncbi:MAG TPA: class I SAM-dependent methyltransferase [Nevskiaceae bacterium]|nr:class I SAM-dependent methyltransferase [Nevskiaceae bacterium]